MMSHLARALYDRLCLAGLAAREPCNAPEPRQYASATARSMCDGAPDPWQVEGSM